jgi:Tfp pilus assembly protein PilF
MTRTTRPTNFSRTFIATGLITSLALGVAVFISGCGGADNSSSSTQVSKEDTAKAKTAGIEYTKQGKYDKAITELKKAVKGDPKDMYMQFSLAQAYTQEKKLNNALSQYKEILKINNKSQDAHFGLGSILMQQNKIDEAIKEFETAAKIDAYFTSVRYSLAKAYVQKKEFEKALGTYGELAKILKNDTYQLARIHFAQGEIFEKMDQAKKAKSEFEKAVALDKNYKEAADKLK